MRGPAMLYEVNRAVLTLCVLSAVGCYEPEWRSMLPEGKANLVVVFRQGLAQQEINDFLDQELQIAAADGGEWLRPGVDAIVKTSADGYPAYAVVLDPSATPEEREAIREGVKSSPYVYRVFENVAPEDIDLDEATAPEGEAAENANGA
jgi:hypothetical protein